MKSILEDLEMPKRSFSGIASMFFVYDFAAYNTPGRVLMHLLSQFVRQLPSPPASVWKLYRDYNAKDKIPDDEAAAVLQDTLSELGRACILLDALDESDQSTGAPAQLLRRLQTLQQLTGSLS